MGPSPQRDFEFDETVLLPEIQRGLGDMYELADVNTEEAMVKWLAFFAEEPTLWKSGGSATGQEALKEFYKKSWEGVEGRIHNVHKVFPLGHGDNALEVMIDGTSDYTFQDGTKGGGKWAARQKYVRENGALKVKEYAVHFIAFPRK